MTVRSACIFVLLILITGRSNLVSAPSPPVPEIQTTPEIQHALAPSGSLRVALYIGTPTSVLSSDDLRGVGYDLGKELARRLKVPFAPILFGKNAEVLEAVKTGSADVAFTNASAERAKDMDFTQPYLVIELGYLARKNAPATRLTDVDHPGVRIGVTHKSSSEGILSRNLKQAHVIPAETVEIGIEMLASGTLDLYATNKATLFQMSDKLPGSQVLEGSWGDERHALAIPKGRDIGLPFVRSFIAGAIASGLVKNAVDRAGLRGAEVPRPLP